MADVMKAMGGGKRGPLSGIANMMGMGGGMPSPEEMQKLAEKMGGAPGALPPTMPDCRRNFQAAGLGRKIAGTWRTAARIPTRKEKIAVI
jgi:signal recognition particle subunit SRP54